MGLGLQSGGVGAAKIFSQTGAQVTVTDLKSAGELQSSLDQLKDLPINFVLGQHREQDFLHADLILRNPDVPVDSPFLDTMRAPIVMDSSLFARYCPLPIIGITGTRGKTTTAMMIYEILTQISDQPIFLGGNIPGSATLELLPRLKSRGLVVLELSSFALRGWHDEQLSPHIAVFTNFYQDHLNRYASMDAYWRDKLAITQYQHSSDWLVVNRDDLWSQKLATAARVRWYSAADLPPNLHLGVPGLHNRANAAAALAVADILHLNRPQVLKILASFPGVPYRLEPIATINDITFINDTTSTTPVATIAALEAIDHPILLIAGGNDKNLDFSQLGQVMKQRVKGVFLLAGSATPKIISALQLAGGDSLILGQYAKLQEAVVAAATAAQPGDVVLLSPAATSFGMFVNEFDRGSQFNTLVKTL